MEKIGLFLPSYICYSIQSQYLPNVVTVVVVVVIVVFLMVVVGVDGQLF